MKKLLLLILVLTSFTIAQDLSVELTSPSKNAKFPACSNILISADANVAAKDLRRVEFFANGTRIKSFIRAPFEYEWENVKDGIYEIQAKVLTKDSQEAFSSSFLIYVGNIDPGNIIINGEFHCDLEPWRLDNYDGAVSTITWLPDLYLTDDSTGVVVDIENPGPNFWSIQLMQPFEIQAGHTYSIYFTAMADEEKEIEIDISKNYDDYAPIFAEKVMVYDLEDFGPLEYTAEADDDNLMFKFVMSGNTTSFFLDAVKVIDQQWTSVEEPLLTTVATFTLEQNYPNPFNPSTRIDFNLEQSENIEFTIYDILGKQLYSFSRFETAGMHSIEWNGLASDGSMCPSGVYLYQLKTASGIETRKMHLLR